MKLTSYQLKRKDAKFWGQLTLLLSTSPYFGKLGWKFEPSMIPIMRFFHQGEPDPEQAKTFTNSFSDSDDENTIIRSLIKTIFRLPPNYQRPSPVWSSSVSFGLDFIPQYNRYHISYQTASNLLTNDQIQVEDIKMFQNKLRILITPHVTEQVKEIRDFYQTKLKGIKEKLLRWNSLIRTRS